MNKYEIMFIVKTDIDEKAQKDTVSAFEKVLTDMKAKVVNTKDMGQKKNLIVKQKSMKIS